MGLKRVVKMLLIISSGLILALIVTAEDEQTPVEEQPAVSIFVKRLGDREYLSPNLISLHSLARAYLPKSFRLINVLEAFRQINNRVRFELVIKAVDTNDNEVCCHIVVSEKPWLRTSLGERARFLDYTNCSSYQGDENFVNESKYELVKSQKECGEMFCKNFSNLESQILSKAVDRTDGQDKYIRLKENEQYSENADKIQDLKRLSEDGREFLETFFASKLQADNMFENSGSKQINGETIENRLHDGSI